VSDDGGKRERADLADTAIPPELRPFVRDRPWPKATKPGENPALDAAAAAYSVPDAGLGVLEAPPVQDLSIGMGNASAYVAPAEVRAAKVGAGPEPGKVEIAMPDMPRALASASPTAETVETRVLGPQDHNDDEPTLAQQPRGPTLGGTERLAVVTASPWAAEAAAAPVAPVELPSSHAPASTRPSSGDSPPSEPRAEGPARGHAKGLALAGAVLGVTVLLGVRAATTKAPGETATGAPAVSTVETATVPAPSVAPKVSASAPEPPASAAVPASASVPLPAPAPSPGRSRGAALRRPEPMDDPFRDAAVPPSPAAPATAAPSVAPALSATIAPTVTPKASPPAPTQDNDGEIFNRQKPKNP
jgi:hypothetical protein